MQGKFIVFYGINRLGKTTQAKRLVDYFQDKDLRAEYLKYPIYKLEPFGPMINEILRSGKKQQVSELEFEMYYTINRFQFEPTLRSKLENGIHIISEDYRGTSLAWGSAKGLDMKSKEYRLLDSLNSKLLAEDVAILFDGTPFSSSIEKQHIHESNSELMDCCRLTHLEVGKQKNWIKINANQPEEKVFTDVLHVLRRKFTKLPI